MSLQKSELVDIVTSQLDTDPELRAQLKIKSDMAAGQLNATAIKKHITAALPYNRNIQSYSKARSYFAKAETVLNQIKVPLESLPPDQALKLINYAFERINRALEHIDDSYSFRDYSLMLLAEMHQNTLKEANFSAAKIGDHLFTLFNHPVSDLYPKIPRDYLEILGDEGKEHFVARLQAEWDKLPPLEEGKKDWQKEAYYRHLMQPLLEQAEQKQDADTLISLYSKTANDFSAYLRLSELCLQHDRLDQALSWRNSAVNAKDKPFYTKTRLEDNQIAIWLYHKQYEPVLELLWQRFAELPGTEAYSNIIRVPGQRDDTSNRHKAIELLQQGIKSHGSAHQLTQNHLDTLAALYLRFQQPDQALLTAEKYELNPDLLLKVIRANKNQPNRIQPLIFRLAEWQINQGKNDSYHTAIEILKTGQQLCGDNQRDIFTRDLNNLLVENKRKRNFSKWARQAFSEIL